MPKQTIDDQIWVDRIDSANRYYKTWQGLFKCDILEDYYEGRQWRGLSEDYRPYTINKIFETVQIKLDSFIPEFPQYTVAAKPGNSDFDLETAGLSAQLKQDVLNTIIGNDKEVFAEELKAAYKDSYFRFGLLEVGYAADWVLNPNAPRPLLKGDTDKDQQGQRPSIKKEPAELPINERIYFKHVPARNFRVGGIDHKYLHRCTWCGYYEWVDKDDLLAIRSLMNRTLVERGTETSKDDSTGDKGDHSHGTDAVKIWHIWDNKAKLRLIVLDEPRVTIFQRPLKRLNLFDFRHDLRVKSEGFYPVPPVFHWLSPQDETNETREQLRAHRRRFIRKFQYVEGSVDEEEIEKFETGGDGALVKVKRENAISAIQDAPLGAALDKAIMTSSDDLNQISGTSAEVRGVADRTTATQANIITQRSSVRENAERDRVAKWLIKVGRETLLTVREKFTLGVWVQFTSDTKESLMGEVQANKPAYEWVSSEDLNDGYDFRIDIDVTTLSSISQEAEKKKFLEFLAIVTQFPQVALSPKLIRECAYRVGYRNEAVIKEMQNMALLHQFSTMSGIAQATQGGQTAQQINSKNTPPQMEQTRNQLQNQLGVT